MLVLTRKQGEAITIGDNIEIVICQVRNGQVRVGISAPEGMLILRPEAVSAELRKQSQARLTEQLRATGPEPREDTHGGESSVDV